MARSLPTRGPENEILERRMLPIYPLPSDRRPDLRDALSVVRLRKGPIVVIAPLVTSFALFFAAREATVYQAASRDLVRAADVGPQTGLTDAPNIATERGTLHLVEGRVLDVPVNRADISVPSNEY